MSTETTEQSNTWNKENRAKQEAAWKVKVSRQEDSGRVALDQLIDVVLRLLPASETRYTEIPLEQIEFQMTLNAELCVYFQKRK